MKQRNGFVSNSSSSSFICNICDGVESGWDLSLSDVDMKRCVNGHEWHDNCRWPRSDELEPTDDEILEAFSDYTADSYYIKYQPDRVKSISDCTTVEELEKLKFYEELYEGFFNEDEEVRELNCPICRFEFLGREDALKYLMKINSYKILSDVLGHVKNDFNTYKEFQEYIKDVK